MSTLLVRQCLMFVGVTVCSKIYQCTAVLEMADVTLAP